MRPGGWAWEGAHGARLVRVCVWLFKCAHSAAVRLAPAPCLCCSVTVDLAAEQGGNIETTVPGQAGLSAAVGAGHIAPRKPIASRVHRPCVVASDDRPWTDGGTDFYRLRPSFPGRW